MIPLIDTVLSELKRRFEGDQVFIFSGLHIIPYIMAFLQIGGIILKIFLKFYKDDFENTSLSTVDGELQLWNQHWKNSKAVLPDSVSATLKKKQLSMLQNHQNCTKNIGYSTCDILCM